MCHLFDLGRIPTFENLSAETKRCDDDREDARKHRRHDGSEVRRDAAGEGEDVERAEHRELERHRLSDVE